VATWVAVAALHFFDSQANWVQPLLPLLSMLLKAADSNIHEFDCFDSELADLTKSPLEAILVFQSPLLESDLANFCFYEFHTALEPVDFCSALDSFGQDLQLYLARSDVEFDSAIYSLNLGFVWEDIDEFVSHSLAKANLVTRLPCLPHY